MVYFSIAVVFMTGIVCIALEEEIKVSKAAVALFMAVSMWGLLLFDAVNIFAGHPHDWADLLASKCPDPLALSFAEQCYLYIDSIIVQHLGDVSETLFFVMASMVIIDIVDVHGGFGMIIPMITTRNRRKFLWVIAFITFFLSALLGNLATVIIVISILRKIVSEQTDRWIYACMVIIAANAGGAWSPIGDVAMLMLWTGNNISPLHHIVQVFPSSLVMMLMPLIFVTFMFPKKTTIVKDITPSTTHRLKLSRRIRYTLLFIALISLAMVPVLKSLLEIPPFMAALFGLVILWIYTDLLYKGKHGAIIENLRVNSTFSRIDMSTILFFLGILMSVVALQTAGHLSDLSAFLDNHITEPAMLSFAFGFIAPILDNVALVAGAMGMYPLAQEGAFMQDGIFWAFLAYCAITGGNLLIIGSASGITVMGMEKISFGYYLKRFSLLALLGFVAGAGLFVLLNG